MAKPRCWDCRRVFEAEQLVMFQRNKLCPYCLRVHQRLLEMQTIKLLAGRISGPCTETVQLALPALHSLGFKLHIESWADTEHVRLACREMENLGAGLDDVAERIETLAGYPMLVRVG